MPSPSADDHLPPTPDWSGGSERHVAPPTDPWITLAEASEFQQTADGAETWRWLRRLADGRPDVRFRTIGVSAGGRAIDMVIASRFGFEPELGRASGKAIVLVQAAIHGGEIDGKDAFLMLLRDILTGRGPDLLAETVLLFVPVLNVDGYADFGPDNRINQRGPREVGRHTNDDNLNLNRDFAKLDAPETRAIVGVINAWDPDLFIDTHVTDGVDYQYDVTFGSTAGLHAWSPRIAVWLEEQLLPRATEMLAREGHRPGPLILAVNDRDLSDGRFEFTANARFTTGYANLRHLPAILIENHSLKPFRRRVLGMYVLLASLIGGVAERVGELRSAVAEDRRQRPAKVPLGWTAAAAKAHHRSPFQGIRSEPRIHAVSGEPIPRWSGEPDERPVLVVPMTRASAWAIRPRAYLLPAHLRDLAARLRLHGIRVETLTAHTEFPLCRTYLPGATILGATRETGIVGTGSAQTIEGRVRVAPGTPVHERVSLTMPAGAFRVATDQDLGDLAVVLLEAESPDSFFQWGFMLGIFANCAHAEPYVLEPYGERLFASDPQLHAVFSARLARDPDFAASPDARRAWLLERTAYRDRRHLMYPILREDYS
jgi:hypothetical protein